MQRQRIWAIAVLMLGGAVAFGAVVGPLIVESAEVTLRKSPSTISPSAGTFPKGTSFDVLEDRGRFVHVKTGETEGWLRYDDLQPRRFVAPSSQLGQIASGSSAGPVQVSDSGKGLGDGVNDIAASYSQSSGVPTTAFEALLQQRKDLVDNGDVAKFAQEGHVGKR